LTFADAGEQIRTGDCGLALGADRRPRQVAASKKHSPHVMKVLKVRFFA
jgi:hypothetical protein